MPPTILHVAQPVVAGVPVVVRGLVQDQVQRGWRVVVASPAEGHLAGWVADAGGDHVTWEAVRSPGLRVVDETRRLRAILRSVQPDLVHLHSAKAGLAGRLAIHGTRPTVFQPHGWSFLAVTGALQRAARGWESLATRWTHALVHVSAGERLLGEQAGIATSWAHVPNGVDLQRFQPADRTAARGRLGLAGGPLVLCIGRICRQKGQDLLLEAWPEVLGRVPDAALAIVGGMDEDGFATPAAESVMWTGDVDDPGDWYAAADVVAIPSRWEAGAPLVAREAMACGRSVVMSDVPGAREDVPAGAGALPAVGDSSALSVAIADRLLDPLRAQREGECGRAYAESHLSVGLSTQRMAALYERTTDSFA